MRIFSFSIIIFNIFSLSFLPISLNSSQKSIKEILKQSDDLLRDGRFEEALGILEKSKISEINKYSPAEKKEYFLRMGSIRWILGDPDKALEFFLIMKKNAEIVADFDSQALSEKIIRIIQLYFHGKELRSKRSFIQSISAFRDAIGISKNIGQIEFEMKCLRQMSFDYYELNDLPEFFRLNEASLKIAQKIQYQIDVGACLNNIGIFYYKTDQYLKALKAYQESLNIAIRMKNYIAEGECLSNIGLIYKSLGKHDLAISSLFSALKIDRARNDMEYISIDLSNIGAVYRNKWLETNDREDLLKALASLNECYEIMIGKGKESIKIRIANNLGVIAADLREYSKALSYYHQGLVLAEKNDDKEGKCVVFCSIGNVYSQMGNEQEALSYLQKSIELAAEINNDQVLWEAFSEIARIQKKKGLFDEALKSGRYAIEIVEKNRSAIENEDFKTSFLRSSRRLDVFHDTIDLLFRMNQIKPARDLTDLAFQYMERAKARGFLDSLEVGRVSAAGKSNPETDDQLKRIQDRLAGASKALYRGPLSAENRNSLEHQVENLEIEYEEIKREIRLRDPIYAGLRFPEIVAVSEVRERILDDDTVILTYAVGNEAAFGLAITRAGETLFPLPPPATLRALVGRHLKIISDPDASETGSGCELYRTLLAPGIDRPFGRMIVVPDDILHYLPFETLRPSPGAAYLATEADLFYVPSLSVLAEIGKRFGRRQSNAMDLLAVAASDPGDANWPTVPYSEKEVDEIAGLFRSKKSIVLKGKEAAESTLKKARFADYKVIHFAAHSLIDDRNPVRSAIVLSPDDDSDEDGMFQAREIYDLRLNAGLVTLSSCRSADGRLIRGEGIVGLNRSFLFAGSSAVLMSLWPVDDQATGHLMGRFYFYLKKGETIAGSLRKAKAEMIESTSFSHPYYWAGFVVTGDAGRRLYTRFSRRLFPAVGAAVVLFAIILFLVRRRRNSF